MADHISASNYDLASLQSGDTVVYGADEVGQNNGDIAGNALASGDINGDGYKDMIVGAPEGDGPGNGRQDAGEVYVIFGKASGLSTVDIASLSASQGLVIYGAAGGNAAGVSVAAGDFNGDGKSDVIIGAESAGNLGIEGKVYVVYGKAGLPSVIDLAALTASEGVVITGQNLSQSGGSTSVGHSVAAGDFNGDGISDVLIGTYLKGQAFLVYGKTAPSGLIDLAALSSATGMMITSPLDDRLGSGVSAGDFNGDGRSELIVTAPGAGNGKVYVISGSAALPALLDLGAWTTGYGTVIEGAAFGDDLGYPGIAAGDFNGDGKSDVMVRSWRMNGTSPSGAYVVYGNTTPATISLSAISSSQGMIISSAPSPGSTGQTSISSGDFNGDGKADVIIGAPAADPTGSRSQGGAAYIIYGKATPPASLDLASLASSDGMKIYGVEAGDNAGFSVSAGDMNGDGESEVFVGSLNGDGPTGLRRSAGEVAVLFGNTSPPATVDLASLAISDGFITYGADGGGFGDGASSVATGDFNGDGRQDFIVGAPFADGPSNGRFNCGEVYVIYGTGSSLSSTIDLSQPSSAGTVIYGAEALDNAGKSLSSGDFNGDGITDLIIGAYTADGPSNARSNSGETYVLYGKASPPASIDLASLASSDGLIVYGIAASHLSGSAVASGDVNGDGKADVIIGAPSIDLFPSFSTNVGDVYVIYGTASPPASLDAASLSLTDGIVIAGQSSGGASGYSVAAGDINADGKDDILIGAPLINSVYAIFGSSSLASFTLSGSLASNVGINLQGAASTGWNSPLTGWSVAAGDINGDGFKDPIIGAPQAYFGPNGVWTGVVYAIWGGPNPTSIYLPPSFSSNVGAKFEGAVSLGRLGQQVFAADLDGNGRSEMILKAANRVQSGSSSSGGQVFVIYGQESLPVFVNLASLSPYYGRRINNSRAGDFSRDSFQLYNDSSLAAADLDGDSLSEIFIGAGGLDGPGNSRYSAGGGYVISLFGDTPPIASNPRQVSGSTDSVTFSWDLSGPFGSAPVMAEDPAFNVVLTTHAAGGSSLSQLYSGLKINTSYYFKVKVFGASDSLYSAAAVGVTHAVPPGAAESTIDNVRVSSVTVHWSSGTALTGYNPAGTRYEASVSTSPDFRGKVHTVRTTDFSATFQGLFGNRLYHARVRALNHSDVGTAYFSVGSAVTGLYEHEVENIVSVEDIGIVIEPYTFSEDFALDVSTDPAAEPLRTERTPAVIEEAFRKQQANPGDPRRRELTGKLVEISARGSTNRSLNESFGAPVRLTFAVENENGLIRQGDSLVRMKSLAVHYLNEDRGLWVKLPSSTVDEDADLVSAQLPHFSVFAIIGKTDTSLNESFAYPVPFQPAEGHTDITFTNLAQVATINIFTIGGGLVQTLHEDDGDGQLIWDVRNADGKPLASGMYFYLIESETDKKVGKLMVIR